jgi:uncharacterized protein
MRYTDRVKIKSDKRAIRIALRYSLLSALIVVALANRAAAIPSDDLLKSLRPTSDVNDFAHLLKPYEVQSLEECCKQLRERTGAQLAIVTLKSLDGGEIDDFTNKLFARWKIGHKDKRDGVLLLVAIADHKARIEVGYDLEPIIPDILAGRIIDQQLRPPFRNAQYFVGLTAAANAICELVEKGDPADRQALARGQDDKPGAISTIIFSSFFVGFGAFILGLGLGLPQVRSIFFGLIACALAGMFAFSIAGVAALAVHSLVGIVCAFFGWNAAKFSGPGNSGSSRTRRSSWNWGGFPGSVGTSWNWGDFSGSSGGSWSSGDGGFSQGWGGFGGGSSGGGGASGSW